MCSGVVRRKVFRNFAYQMRSIPCKYKCGLICDFLFLSFKWSRSRKKPPQARGVESKMRYNNISFIHVHSRAVAFRRDENFEKVKEREEEIVPGNRGGGEINFFCTISISSVNFPKCLALLRRWNSAERKSLKMMSFRTRVPALSSRSDA